jgi:hypothetical protein
MAALVAAIHVWTWGNRCVGIIADGAAIRVRCPVKSSIGGKLMTHYVGLDVSQKTTAIDAGALPAVAFLQAASELERACRLCRGHVGRRAYCRRDPPPAEITAMAEHGCRRDLG